MQQHHVRKKFYFDLLTPYPGSVVSAGKIFATMFLYSWFSLIWYVTWPCPEKVKFWPTDPVFRVGGGGRGVEVFGEQLICYHAAAFSDSLWYATWPCSKKVEFWPNDPIPRVGCVCEQNVSYHVAAFVILFNLIYNITVFWKKWIFTYWHRPQGRGVCGWVGRDLRAKYLLPCCYSLWFPLNFK